MKESTDLSKSTDSNIVIFPNENDLLIWYAYLFGPDDSPFRDGIFKVYNNNHPLD